MGIIPIDKKCNNSKEMRVPIYIKAENMNTKEVDVLIYQTDDALYLRYTNEDFFKSKYLYKAINIRGTIGKYINLAQKCSSWDGVYITEGAMNYIKDLHNLTDEKFQAEIFSYSPVKEILPMKKALKTIGRQDHFNKSKIKLEQLKLKPDNEFINTVELDVDDIVYFLKMDEIFEYSFTDSKLKIKDLLEEYKLKDLVYVTGYLPDDSTKKVIIEESNFSTLKDTRKCLDLIAKKIKIKEGK